MQQISKTYLVKFIRSAGLNPETGEYVPEADQSVEVDSYSEQGAVAIAKHFCSLEALGQKRRIFIGDKEFIDPTF